jgi:hypothetical protein
MKNAVNLEQDWFDHIVPYEFESGSADKMRYVRASAAEEII